MAEIGPLKVDFPHAQTIVRVSNEVTDIRTGAKKTNDPDRYFISSKKANELTASEWKGLPRGHWGGVEIRCNWRADACMYEDKTRSNNYNILCNTMLLRHALMGIFIDYQEQYVSLPSFIQAVASDQNFALKIIRQV